MYCIECGKKIDKDSKFCEFCGTLVRKGKLTAGSRNEQADNPNIGRWSWGGAAITFWYVISMRFGIWWVLLTVALLITASSLTQNSGTSWLGILLYLAIFLYVGFNARKWSWHTRKWDNLEQFLQTQRAWDIWGIIICVLGLLIGLFGTN